MSGLRVFVALAVSAAAADALRCNTYIGTDFSSSGAGIETCTYATKCIQRKYYVLGVRTYQMSCDDLLECHDQPANVCCTLPSSPARYPNAIRCAPTNFNETSLNASSFGPECAANCSS